jgi:hypothetical protein
MSLQISAANSSYRSYWKSSLESACESVNEKISWFVKNRGGMACLVGLLLVPAQWICPGFEESNRILEKVTQNIQRIRVPMVEGIVLNAVVYYPKNWDPNDRSRCILYHSPNRASVSEYFRRGTLGGNPAKLAELEQCPVLLYDYRGTGMNSGWGVRSTYLSVVEDGDAMLKYALGSFDSIKVVGSSLGGGVATVALDRYLAEKPEDALRVSLWNHDSFSTTPRVIFPYFFTVADGIGAFLGGLVDAETSMKNLIRRGIAITVLCHTDDPIIPKSARMAEFVAQLPKVPNVSVIYSKERGHANLSQDLCARLKNQNRI